MSAVQVLDSRSQKLSIVERGQSRILMPEARFEERAIGNMSSESPGGDTARFVPVTVVPLEARFWEAQVHRNQTKNLRLMACQIWVYRHGLHAHG